MTVEEGLKMVVSGGIVTPGADEADEEEQETADARDEAAQDGGEPAPRNTAAAGRDSA